jgi:hypothetical protein
MKLSNSFMDLFISSLGQKFKVTNVCQDVKTANSILEKNPDIGVISTDDEGNIYLAEIKPTEETS